MITHTMADHSDNPLFSSEPYIHTHGSRVGDGSHVHVEWETDEPDDPQTMHDTGPFNMRRQLLAQKLAVAPESHVAAPNVSMAHPSQIGEQLRQARTVERPQPETEHGPKSAARR